jgi:hypothetical protein
MEKHKAFLQSVADENSALIAKINQLTPQSQTQSQEDINSAIKQCLLQLYETIIQMSQHRGNPRTPRLKVINAWKSLLQPIQALNQLPFGDFLTARMLLYLAMGLRAQHALDMRVSTAFASKPSFPLDQMDIAMDDTLLKTLGKIWTESDKSEQFDWVFGEYRIGYWRPEDKDEEDVQPHLWMALAEESSSLERRMRWMRTKIKTSGRPSREVSPATTTNEAGPKFTSPMMMSWKLMNGFTKPLAQMVRSVTRLAAPSCANREIIVPA